MPGLHITRARASGVALMALSHPFKFPQLLSGTHSAPLPLISCIHLPHGPHNFAPCTVLALQHGARFQASCAKWQIGFTLDQ